MAVIEDGRGLSSASFLFPQLLLLLAQQLLPGSTVWWVWMGAEDFPQELLFPAWLQCTGSARWHLGGPGTPIRPAEHLAFSCLQPSKSTSSPLSALGCLKIPTLMSSEGTYCLKQCKAEFPVRGWIYRGDREICWLLTSVKIWLRGQLPRAIFQGLKYPFLQDGVCTGVGPLLSWIKSSSENHSSPDNGNVFWCHG